MTTHGEYLIGRGLAPACTGGDHVLPVPDGYDAETVVAEISAMGRLMEPPASEDACVWATVRCPGGDGCWCQSVDLGPHFRAFVGDVQVYP